jgi:hypothetical protein
MINVERSLDLDLPNSWTHVDTFPAPAGITYWSEPVENDWSKAFYRVGSN